MDYITYILWGLVLLFLLRRFLPKKGINKISTAELKNTLKDKNKQFIDVRTPGEYKNSHIREFKNIPLQQLSAKANQLDRDKEVVVICQSGMRSSQAASVLKKLGFTHITNVQGGMNAWRS